MPTCARRRRLDGPSFTTPASLVLAALLASACADDSIDAASSGTGGSTGTSPSVSSSSGGPSSSSGLTGQSSSGQGGQGQGGDGQGGNAQGGNGQGGNAQGGNGQGGDGQGGNGVGGNGQGGNGVGGNGQGGNGVGGNGVGGNGQGGAGVGGAPPVPCDLPSDCDDSATCTVDVCNDDGFCANVPMQAECDDGVFCNGVEQCDPEFGAAVTGCAPSSGSPCDDGVACTTDACDEGAGTCTNTTDDAACDNGIACDGVETCDAQDNCVSGVPQDCDDGVACTVDVCDATSGQCASVPSDLACSDGLFCNGSESCDAVAGCQAGTAPTCDDGLACTDDSCDEAADSCAFAPDDSDCADADLCDGDEVCDPAQGCVEGPVLDCDDGVVCTVDSCDPVTGCSQLPNDAACGDGSDCDGEDFCDPDLGCQDGDAVVCVDDGIPCTVEMCDEVTLGCSSVPDNGACPSGQFCIPQQGGCVSGAACDDPGDCTDGDPCNGIEVCSAGTCAPGVEVVCNDGIDCTFDACDPADGLCDFIPQPEECSNGNACDGAEACVPGTGCVAGAPVNCNDGVACTIDTCNAIDGTCSNNPNHAGCSDGNPCDGDEQCTANGCQEGVPLVCPGDGIACTSEQCVPGLGCASVPNDALCPCTQTCNVQAGGCGNFCAIAECQGHTYQCGDCIDNDGDCRVDASDTQCLGACDNTENSLYGGIPGQNNSPCKHECYFDQDTGAGNDDCHWSHKCDPLEVAPDFPPEGDQCRYNQNANIPGYQGSCATAFQTQSQDCADYCGPLTPNGCDCFGCCEIPGAPTTVWLGSEDDNGNGSCTLANVANPDLCKPCTQVPACLNSCDQCEICIGQPTLPPECSQQVCPPGDQLCGQPGQSPCPTGEYCVTGCCQPLAD